MPPQILTLKHGEYYKQCCLLGCLPAYVQNVGYGSPAVLKIEVLLQTRVPAVAIGKPERQVRKASHWHQATIEITCHGHSILIACSRHVYISIVLRAHSVRGESHIQRNVTGEVATLCTMCLRKKAAFPLRA